MVVTCHTQCPPFRGKRPQRSGRSLGTARHIEWPHAFVGVQGQSHPGWMLVPDLEFVSASPGPFLRRKAQLHVPGLPGERPQARFRQGLREHEDWGRLCQCGPKEEESGFLVLLQPGGIQIHRVHRGEAVTPGMLLAGFRVRPLPGRGDAGSPRQPRDQGFPFGAWHRLTPAGF